MPSEPKRHSESRPTVPSFKFFGLPRELRDAIYGYLGEEESYPLPGPRPALQFQTQNVPSLKLRLVNRQFRRELLQIMLLLSSIECWFHLPFGTKTSRPTPLMERAPSVTMHFAVHCVSACPHRFEGADHRCSIKETMEKHGEFARYISSNFHQLQHIRTNLYLMCTFSDPLEIAESQKAILGHQVMILSKIAEFKDTAEMNVYRHVSGGERTLLMTYSLEADSLLDVEVAKPATGAVHSETGE